jgi:WD40 repeat protein
MLVVFYRYAVAGFVSGLVAVFDLETTSKLLKKYEVDESGTSVLTYFPFWLINTHLAAVTGVHIDPVCPRFFYTGSMDRTLKAWDMDLRSEIETKKVGCMIDSCFVRGTSYVV